MEFLKRLLLLARSMLSKAEEPYEHEGYDWRRKMYDYSQTQRDPVLASYYANLEIPYGADLESTKQAYRRLLKRYHPDLHSTDPEKRRLAHKLTLAITEAYKAIEEVLTEGR